MVAEKDVTLQVRITSALMKRIDAAADEIGLTRSNWVCAVVARAVDKGAFGNWKPDAIPRKGARHGSKQERKPAP